MTVADIDAELRRLAAEQAEATDPQVAGAIELHRLQLEGNRRVAAAIAEAQRRVADAARARAAREGLAVLEAELPAALRARAVAIDEWIEQGAALVEAYRTTCARLAGLHDLPLPPPRVGQEFDLLFKRRRLDLSARLDEALRAAGILAAPGRRRAERDPARTCEAFAVETAAAVFDMVRARLSPVTTPAAPTDTTPDPRSEP